MRVLVLNYEFPPVGGGGGRVAEDLCRTLARRGHEIRVETVHVPGLPRQEVRDGYVIRRNYAMRRKADTCTPLEMAAYVALNWWPSFQQVRRWKPDVIHVHFAVPTGVLGYLCSRLSGIPYVMTAHLGDVPGGVPEQTDRMFRYIKPLTVPIWRRAAHVVAVSRFVRDLSERAYGVPVQVIHNGIEIARCRPASPHPGRPRRLLFAGRFSIQKNALFLARALARLDDLDWTITMFGDGPLMQPVKDVVRQAGLGARVHLPGWVRPEQVEAAMSQSDVLVMPSLSEGLSVVALQALGHGLAIVASDIGGFQDLVGNGRNGFLCPVNDQQAFCQNLRRVLTSDDLLTAMKLESRRWAVQFDLEHIADQYDEVFRKVAA